MADIFDRISPQGRQYSLYSNEKGTKIVSGKKSIQVDAGSELMNRSWFNWTQRGMHCQDAFPFLNSEEREFLISGTTPTEWKALFGNAD